MKSKDLRIGNKVQVSIFESEKDFKENVKDTHINQEWFIGNIESIEPFNLEYTYNIELDTKEKHANNIEEWERVEPIPLTEEWLFKIGFEIRHQTETNKYFYRKSGFNLWIFGVDNYLFKWNSGNTTIKYVHQLQNLYFALTGKELVFSEA